MQPQERDESTVIDLAVVGTQGQPRQQNRSPNQRARQQAQQQEASAPPSSSLPADSPHIFDHLSSLDSPDIESPPTTSSTNNSAGGGAKGPSRFPKGGKGGEKKDCPRHAEGHPPNKLTTRDLGSKRVVSLFYGSDVVLFDTISAYRLGNPDKRVEDAIDVFSEHQGADALANIIYETQAFDMIFKYPIPDYLRRVPEEPPVLGKGPTLSDIELHSTSSAAEAFREEKLEKKRQLQEKNQQEQLISMEAVPANKDVEAAVKDHKTEKGERLERHRIRFKKALLRESLIIEEEPNIEGEEMYMKVYTPFWRLCIEAQRLRYKVELTNIEANKEKAAAEAAVIETKKQGWWSRNFLRLLQKADNVSLPLRAESLLFKASKLRQYALAEKSRKWSDIVRHGGGVKPDGSGVGSKMGSDGKEGFFGTGRRGNLTESIIIYCKIRTKHGDRHALKPALDRKVVTDMYTLHDGSYKSKVLPIPNRRTVLYNDWVRSRHPQLSLEEVRFYYGEKIALYFAWIAYYTKWLIPAAIVGFIFIVFGLLNYAIFEGDLFSAKDSIPSKLINIFDNAMTLPFTLFMSIWSSLFVEFWKRRSNVLAYQWNTLDFERRERARPEFKPTGTRISPVTGRTELYYPRYKQIISTVISVMIVVISILIVIVSVGSLLIFNAWLRNTHNSTSSHPISSYAISVITAVMNLAVIMILGTIYAKLAKILTDNENHRRLTQYEDALIFKRFLFDFVNFYSALVYIAFFKETVGTDLFTNQDFRDKCEESCMVELTIQLAIVFVGKQFLNQFQELAVPLIQKWWNRKSELAEKASLKGKYKDKKNMIKPPQWAKDDTLPDYDPNMFEEYRELVIQFGFCTLFVTAFPVAPIFALINNVLEVRVDAYKLLTQHRRPVSQAAQDIGSWSTILMLLTHISVFTNACLIAFQSTWMETNVFRKVAWTAGHPPVTNGIDYPLLAVRLLFIFIYEHFIFLTKVIIANFIRDIPQTVKLAIERENYYTRLALDDEEPAMDEVLEEEDDDTDESDDEDDLRKKLMNAVLDDNYTNYDEKDGRPSRLSAEGGAAGGAVAGLEDAAAAEDEDAEELEALIKAGGCGCAAHGDGIVGTVKGGFDGTWMSRFKPDTQAALRRRQQRRRKRQNANKAQDEV